MSLCLHLHPYTLYTAYYSEESSKYLMNQKIKIKEHKNSMKNDMDTIKYGNLSCEAIF